METHIIDMEGQTQIADTNNRGCLDGKTL